MAVTFSKQNSVTFNQQNIVDILGIVDDKKIRELANSRNQGDYIKVMGDVHKSQFIAAKQGLFWFKIKGFEKEEEIPSMASVHIFICFRLFRFDKKHRVYTPTKKCVNPEMLNNSYMPDISRLMGSWEYNSITLGH